LSTPSAILKTPRAKPTRRDDVPDSTLHGLAEVFAMLADPSRLRILLTLARDGEMHVSALRDVLGMSQPAVSHHLSQMRARRLVSCRRDGKNNYYSVDSATTRSLLDDLFDALGNSQRQIQLDGLQVAFKSR
jgi:ArsR family transcriptional regulator